MQDAGYPLAQRYVVHPAKPVENRPNSIAPNRIYSISEPFRVQSYNNFARYANIIHFFMLEL